MILVITVIAFIAVPARGLANDHLIDNSIWDQGNRSKASVVDAGARNKQKADIWDQGNRKKENIFSQGNGARPKQNNTIHGIQRKAHDSEMSEINNVR